MKSVLLFLCFLLQIGFIRAKDNGAISQSPYKLDLKTDLFAIGVSSICYSTSLFLEKNVSAPSANYINNLSKNNINSIDRTAANKFSNGIAQTSDITVISLGTLPVLFLADSTIRNDFAVLTAMYAETMFLSYSISKIAKTSSLRARPYLYNNDLSLQEKISFGKDSRYSFFSNHTTFAFATATFISQVFPKYFNNSDWELPLNIGVYTIAGAVGYMRYESGRHFPTDIAVGAIVGTSVGYLVPYMHESARNSNITLYPQILPNYYAVNLQIKL